MLEKEFEEKSKEIVAVFRKKIASLRAGKPNPEMVEFLPVFAYGKKMLLRELASIGVVPPNQITIQVWDESIVSNIKEALAKSGLNLPIQTEGKLIKLIFPPLSQEQREEIKKILYKKKEEAKISLKNLRQEILKKIERLFEEKEISEDEKFRLKEKIQEKTEKVNEEIEEITLKKEKEIMEK